MNYNYITEESYYLMTLSQQLWVCSKADDEHIQRNCDIIPTQNKNVVTFMVDGSHGLIFTLELVQWKYYAFYSYNLDGTNSKRIKNIELSRPNSISQPLLDTVSRSIYYARYNRTEKYTPEDKIIDIVRISYNGLSETTCKLDSEMLNSLADGWESSLSNGLKLDKSDGYLYLTSKSWNHVIKIDFSVCKIGKCIVDNDNTIHYFAIMHRPVANDISPISGCDNCDQVCLTHITDSSFELKGECKCRYGFERNSETDACQPISMKNGIVIIRNRLRTYLDLPI